MSAASVFIATTESRGGGRRCVKGGFLLEAAAHTMEIVEPWRARGEGDWT